MRRNNTSGHHGVMQCFCKGVPQWTAILRVDDKVYSRYFSVNKYGDAKAYELAVKAREALLRS